MRRFLFIGLVLASCASGALVAFHPGVAHAADPVVESPFGFSFGIGSLLAALVQWLMSLAAWLLGVALALLDYAAYYTVIDMPAIVHGLASIGTVWRVLRDIGNLILIFGFIAVGITVILDVKWYGGSTKMLPTLLMAALLINFSLFISEAIIDVSNLFATEFYTEINGGTLPTKATDVSAYEDRNLSTKIMSQLGLADLYGDARDNKDLPSGTIPFYLGVLGVILFSVLAFVIFFLAFILIARFVILLLLMLVSPLGFAGLAVPGLSKIAEGWWHQLFEQAFTAPVMLLVLYVALRIITDPSFLTGFNVTQGSYTNIFSGTDTAANLLNFASVLIMFTISVGLLFAVVIIAKKMSAFGAKAATDLASTLTFRAAVAGGAFVGRRTVGRAAYVAGERFSQSRHARRWYGGLISGALKYGASASYDARGAGLRKLPGGVDLGKVSKTAKGGYSAIVKAGTENRTKYAKDLKLNPEEEKIKKQLETQVEQLEKQKKQLDGDDSEEAKRGRGELDRRIRFIKEEEVIEFSGGRQIRGGLNALAQAAQAEYQKNLSQKPPPGIAQLYQISAGPRIDVNAAKKIKGDLKKSRVDKDLDTIKKLLENEEKKESGSGEEKKEEAH